MSNQNLSGVSYDDKTYTIIFICVSSHNGQMFSFVNNLNDRFEFFWNRWSEWKDLLTPYTVHAFLVHSYNTRSDSGMGFTPEAHLCEFMNLTEARVFNSAYLMKYQKVQMESVKAEVDELAMDFGASLLAMQEMRAGWMEECEKTARTIYSKDVMREFFGAHPTPTEATTPWDKDLFNDDFFQGCCDIPEQPLNLNYVDPEGLS